MSIAFTAMQFAREVHKDQRRKYTNAPYIEHLAEVAGIVATVATDEPENTSVMVATAWLHDCVEDQGIDLYKIEKMFGIRVAAGVSGLSDIDPGNRATRKAAARERLAICSAWIQTIKCADLISNTKSIVEHDPKFAEVYVAEARMLLDVMERADPRLREIAYQQL